MLQTESLNPDLEIYPFFLSLGQELRTVSCSQSLRVHPAPKQWLVLPSI